MTTIQEIVMKDVQKRRAPTKHYAYIIDVHWSDGKNVTIGRRYSEFFDFQMSLLEKFPEEAGQQNPKDRSIPFLPGKSIFSRTNTRDFALKRMGQIAEYCTGIAKMPPHISTSDFVLDFFKANFDDKDILKAGTLNVSPEKGENKKSANEITGPLVLDKYVAIADYKKDNRKELGLKAGDVVEVVEKSENGWWLASNEEGMNGWVPAVFLESLYGEQASPTEKRVNVGEGEMFKAITDYKANSDDELSFDIGDILEILEKNLEGWWYANKDGAEGWVPATFLDKSSSSSAKSPPPQGNKGFQRKSVDLSKPLPPRRTTVRRTLTSDAVTRVQNDFKAKWLKQASIEENDEEEFAGEYTTVGAFQATIDDGISFEMNETVHVIQKSSAGWWYGRIGDKRGWVPESYLEAIEPTPKQLQKSQGIPLPTAFEAKPKTPEASKKTIGVNGTSTENKQQKSTKPVRPPAPKISPGKGQTTVGRGWSKYVPMSTSPPARSDTRSPLSPLPALPQNRGFIPTSPSRKKKDLQDYNWYREIPRQEAEVALVSEGQEGYFIVRPSQRGAKQEKPYSLTLYHHNQNWNFHIRLRTDKKYAVGIYKESEPAFSSLPELVEYYREYPLVIGEEERKVKLVDSPSELYDTC